MGNDRSIHERLFTDLLVMQETQGDEKTIAFLEQELARLRVVKEYRTANRRLADLEAQTAALSEQVAFAIDALEFYAADENHERRNGKPSPIERDKGRRARETLEALTGSDEADEETE